MIYNNDRDPNDEMWEKDTTTDRTNEEYAQEQADNALASVQATEACVKADMEYIEPCTPVESIVHDMSVVERYDETIIQKWSESQPEGTPYADSLMDGSAFKFSPRYNEKTGMWSSAPTGGWPEPIPAIYRHMVQNHPVYSHGEYKADEPPVPGYSTLEQILADIWKIETREITVQELAMKVCRTINEGAYIQQDGTK